jgi:hypothetical protein
MLVCELIAGRIEVQHERKQQQMKYEKPYVRAIGTAVEAIQSGLTKDDLVPPDGDMLHTESAYHGDE